ncbi:hypothetical protein ACFYPZ_24535 [Streptomyces sp. NPDC005506]|uniref:hypothetical protein n=1 Tax=Streptomyces sp. NPDC005506 TaxID=3364718 RepID=UPI00369E45CC
MSDRELHHRDDKYDEPEYDQPDYDGPDEDEIDDFDDDFSGGELARREATKKPYRFRGPNGTVFSVPHPDLWSVRGHSSLESGDIPAWAMEVFEQDVELAQALLDLPMGVFRPVMTKIGQLANETSRAGLNRGERRASARTSRNTPRNSKRR